MGFKVKLFLFVLILIVGFVGFANAQYYEQGQDIQIRIPCSEVNCSESINLTIIYPNSSIAINNQEMSASSGFVNYTFSLASELGEYNYITSNGFKDSFEVTYTGKQISTAQGLLYVPLFTLLVLFFVIILLGINQLPSSNQRDEEGKILSVTYLKYLRAPLWVLEYMLIVAMLYLSSNLAFAYLNEQLFAQILFTLFQISFGVTPIIIIVWMVWIYVSLFHDKQFQNMLNRGIFPEGRL